MSTINYELLPEHMREGMRRYIEHGILPGSFLRAVLTNDLMEACGQADDINLARLADYARFLYNYAPRGAYGSKENVAEWIKHRGLAGLNADDPA